MRRSMVSGWQEREREACHVCSCHHFASTEESQQARDHSTLTQSQIKHKERLATSLALVAQNRHALTVSNEELLLLKQRSPSTMSQCADHLGKPIFVSAQFRIYMRGHAPDQVLMGALKNRCARVTVGTC